MSENWPQGGSGGYGDDPYGRPEPRTDARSEPRPDTQGRGRRRAGGPPAEGGQRQPDGQRPPEAQRPDPRTRPQRPQNPYDQPPYGQNPYGQPSTAQSPYGGTSGSYPTDPYATGGGYPAASAPPRRPQPAQPQQRPQPPQSPQRPPAGRAPYDAVPQTARDPYGRERYDTGQNERYDTGANERYETGQFERQQYDRQPGGRLPYDREPFERESYDQEQYREDPRSASSTGSRRRVAQEPAAQVRDPYDRDDDDDDLPRTRTRRRGGGARTDDQDESERFRLMDDDEDGDGGSGGGRGGRRPKQPKRGRNCLAVVVAFAVLAGGLGIGGYEADQWYQKRHALPADYTATTNSQLIDVVIPSGSGGGSIGEILYKADVVKSQAAFETACANNPQCSQIEANTYLLPKEISAAAAVTLLLNPTSVDTKGEMSTYGGERAAQVFAVLEAKKGWTAAAITTALNSGQIGLPTWDTAVAGPTFPYARIEGFIAAEQYNLGSFTTPQALLTKMVSDQLALFTTTNFAARATALGVTEYQLLIIASMAQAEAANPTDYGNIAQVVFNRLKDKAGFSHLGFDTVTLYGMGNTVTVPTSSDLENSKNPYNTHLIVGLPPSPIGNPDQPALTAAATPTANTYLYFCAVSSTNTQYATTNQEWANLGREYPTQCGGG